METSEDVVEYEYTCEEMNALLGILVPPPVRMWVRVDRIRKYGSRKWTAKILMARIGIPGDEVIVAAEWAQTKKAALKALGWRLQDSEALDRILEYVPRAGNQRYNFSWTAPTWTGKNSTPPSP